LKFSTFRNKSDNKPQTVEVADWVEFVDWLNDFKLLADKDGPGWSPATFTGTRSVSNVELISCLAFDIDENIDPEVFAGFECVMHTTYTPGRWRLVMCTSRPHTKQEHKVLWQRIFDRLEGEKHGFDDSCSDSSRFYYLPAEQVDGAGQFISHSGEIIDVDAYTKTSIPPPRNFLGEDKFLGEDRKEPEAYDSLNLIDQAKAKKKPELLAFLRGEAPTTGGRDNFLHDAINHYFSFLTPLQTMASCRHLASSVLDRMECQPEGRAYWNDKVEMLIQKHFKHIDHRDKLEQSIRNATTTANAQGKPAPAGIDWRQALQRKKGDDGGPGAVLPTGKNVHTILSNDPEFKDIKYNLVFKTIEVGSGFLQTCNPNHYETALANWLSDSEYRIKVARDECNAQLNLFFQSRAYDPLKTYLEGLEYKGTKYLDTLLSERCGVVDGDPEYIRLVSRKFMISAVARALDPGCQADSMLILVGEGGAGKTTFVRKLGGQWASDVSIDLHSKDVQMQVARTWLMEMSEMVSTRKSDKEALKAFLTRTTDSFRPPYGKVIEDVKRRAVFIGTANDEEIIAEPEGARRYWPVRVGVIDTAWIEANRDALWAEAVHAYNAGEEWWFDRAGQLKVQAEQAVFMQAEPLANEIELWFSKQAKDKRPEFITASKMLQNLGYDFEKSIDQKAAMRVGKVLRKLGCLKKKARNGEHTENIWIVSARLRDGVQTKTGYTISPVPDLKADET
jgi:predicted P-loop ATPase